MTLAPSPGSAAATPLRVEWGESPNGTDPTLLARCAFGVAPEGAIAHPGLVALHPPTAFEGWSAGSLAETGRHGAVAWCRDETLLFGHVVLPIEGDAVVVTRRAYNDLFGCCEALGYHHPLRIWNFLPGINRGQGDDERYKLFCAGRARAFDEAPHGFDGWPAGTAIGSVRGDELQVYFLAATAGGQPVENPRQVSAPDYPRRYGPRSPLFCRAMRWPGDGGGCLLVSGTASIVGHESRHPHDTRAQLHETWHNLEALREAGGAAEPTALRAYLRRPRDYPMVRAFLEQRLGPAPPVVYLQADVCRAELMLEIEGVYRLPARGES